MDKLKAAAITASIAGAASYVWVSSAICYAAEPADLEPIPLGATVTGMGGSTTTTSFSVSVIIPNPMGDDPIQVVNGVPDYLRGALLSQKWGTRSPS